MIALRDSKIGEDGVSSDRRFSAGAATRIGRHAMGGGGDEVDKGDKSDKHDNNVGSR